MKIDNSLKTILSGPSLEDTARSARKSAAEPAPVAGDKVELSPLSSSLQAIEKGFAETPVVDTARVDEIKQAIASGHFTVNADKVADRLLKTVQELIHAHKA
jgi:negative regulator of flagellin synthesis FlgM